MTLGPDQWARLEELFHRATDLSRPEQEALLKAECPDDPALAAELRSLLEAAEAPSMPAVDAVQRSWDRALHQSGPSLVGRRIGAYRLDRELGRGGMGVVYLGVREDGEFSHTVAIKVLPGALLDDLSRWRFRNERRILANLKHPGIARLLDGGETEDGLPFVIMDYVDGLPIDQFCEKEGLNTRDRLELFLQVASAVSHAHAHLVVHRDLKPGNIFVLPDGTPRLLDFGIAKLLSPDGDTEVTRMEARALTPNFASPEQIRGEEIGTASDVYSLGVLLFRILTGSLPFDLAGRSPAEMEDTVGRTQPPLPSRVSGHRALTGDIDNIILTALRKDPERRYPSVDLLASDIRRHLEGRPVAARPATLRYRAGKFVRRNVGAVLSTVLFLAVLAGFSLTLAFQAARIAEERDTAEAERAKATAVSDFLMQVFSENDPNNSKGVELTAGDILSRGGERIRNDLGAAPEVKGQILQTIGTLYRRLGVYDSAEVFLFESLELREAELGRDHPDHVRSLDALARLAEARGEMDRARALFQDVLEARERGFGPESEEFAAALYEMGRFQLELGESEAREVFARAVAIRRGNPDTPEGEFLRSLEGLASSLRRDGQSDSAATVLEDVLTEKIRVHGPDHLSVASTLNNLGAAYYTSGQLDRAEGRFLESVALRERLTSPDHPAVLVVKNNLALTRSGLGRYEEAEALYREIIRIRQERGDAPITYASPLHNLGLVLTRLDRPQDAIDTFQEAVAVRREALGERHPQVAFPLMGLGRALELAGRLDESEEAMREGLGIRVEALGPTARLVGLDHYALGRFLLNQSRVPEAEEALREALRIQREVLTPTHVDLGETLAALGKLRMQEGDSEEGVLLLRESIGILEEVQSVQDIDLGELRRQVENGG